MTIDAALGSSPVLFGETGTGHLWRLFSVGANRTPTLNSILANPERHYLNIHTAAHPGGLVRAQLKPVNTAPPVTGPIISSVSDPSRTTAAPGALMSIFEENLAKSSSSLAGFPPLENVPTSLNRTSATLANLAMPVLLVSPSPPVP